MKTALCFIISLFFLKQGSAQTAHECFAGLQQNSSKSIPAILTNMQKRLAAIDFYPADHQKVIKRVEGAIVLNDDNKIKVNGNDCAVLNNYNVFNLYVKKRKPQNGVYYAKFDITAYEFANNSAATVFFDKVLHPIAKLRSERKDAYTCLLSGKYCYLIRTPAFMFFYDYMDKIVKAVDGKARRFDHF